jgi:TrmH family RNA methyltransferase
VVGRLAGRATCFNQGDLSELPSRFKRRTPQDPLTRRDEALAFLVTDDTWRPPEWFHNVEVVLVEPTDQVNIGGVIRVMANTGFLNLRLVSPAQFREWEIIGVAHYTQHIFESTRLFDSLEAAVADAHVVIGLIGKHQRITRNSLTMADAVARVATAAQSGERVAIAFGREDRGLSNQMLDRCHFVTTIPTNPGYPSLNLAQAALLFLYQLFQRAGGEDQPLRPPRRPAPPASSRLLEELFADLERALEAIEFLKLRSRPNTMRSLRVALYRARLDVREASLLRAMAIEMRNFLRRRGVLREVGPVGAHRPAEVDTPDEGRHPAS